MASDKQTTDKTRHAELVRDGWIVSYTEDARDCAHALQDPNSILTRATIAAAADKLRDMAGRIEALEAPVPRLVRAARLLLIALSGGYAWAAFTAIDRSIPAGVVVVLMVAAACWAWRAPHG
jgi:hypothetical protein